MANETQEPTHPGLTPREKAFAEGKGLMAGGMSSTKAAALVGVSDRTLRDHYRRWRDSDPTRRERLEQQLIARKYEITVLADQEIVARLQDPEQRQTLTAHDLNMLSGTATDKIARFQRWEKRSDLDLGDLSAKLGAVMDDVTEASFSLTKADGSQTSVQFKHNPNE